MRGVLAVIWAVVVFFVVLVVVNLCAMLGFPPGSTSANVMRIAGVVIALGLAASAYRRNSAGSRASETPPAA